MTELTAIRQTGWSQGTRGGILRTPMAFRAEFPRVVFIVESNITGMELRSTCHVQIITIAPVPRLAATTLNIWKGKWILIIMVYLFTD